MNPDPQDVDTVIQSAIDALKRGDTVTVTRIARQAATIAPESEVAWLLLAAVAKPDDSLAFVLKALQINPQSQAALEALEWAQSKLHSPPAEETLPAMDADQPAEAEPESPADALEHPEKAFPPPGQATTELEAASVNPAFETENLDDVYSLSAGSPQAPEAESERPVEEIPALPEKSSQTKWTFAATAPAPGQMHDSIHPASLTDSRSPTARRRKRSVFSTVLIFLISALAVVAIAALIGLIFLRPQLSSLWADIFAGDGCQASLVIGSQTYQVWPIKSDTNGYYAVPAKQPGRAYYVEDTSSNYVLFLSPVSDNQTLMTGLQAGFPASVTWSNCTTNNYRLAQPVPEILDMPDLLSQNRTGITVIVPWQGSSSGFVLKGTLDNFLLPEISTPDASLAMIAPEATAQATSLPINITGFSEFLAEISLLEIIPSADLTTIQAGISIYNYGNLAGRLTVSDIALTPDGGTPLAAWLTEPALPLELAPGATQTLTLTFPRPSTATAILKILSVEYELAGY